MPPVRISTYQRLRLILQKYPFLPDVAPIILVLTALFFQVLFHEWLSTRTFLLLYPAISLGCLVGNRRSSIAATVIGAWGVWYLFMPEDLTMLHYLSIAAFFTCGMIVSIVSDLILKGVKEQIKLAHALEKSQHSIIVERENFRDLFKQTPEMVCILSGPEHLFEFVNEAHIQVLGFDATGMTVRNAQPESVEVHGILDEVYQTGNTAKLIEIPVTVGASLRFFNLTYSARHDDDGNVNGVMMLGTEVTAEVQSRHEIIASQKRYHQLFDLSPLAKWIFDVKTFEILDVNMAAVKLYGFSKEEFLKMKATDLRPPEEIPKFIRAMSPGYCENPEKNFRIFRHRKKDGSLIDVEISAFDLVMNGRKVRISAILDITERLAIENRQQELLANLQAAKDEAERANQLKSSFLANMSHEIRTPLGAMLGFADLLRDHNLTQTERDNYIGILTRNGHQLATIINDILDLSKVEAGHMTFEFSDISSEETCSDVISLLKVNAEEKNIALEYTADPSTPEKLVTDPLRLRQILFNIVGNAIKFTPSGSVRVRSYGKHIHGKTRLYFEVTDTGIGIPDSAQEKVFESFVQADGTLVRKYGGTGLGLALSRQLARKLGGEVRLRSSVEGEGSVFVVSVQDLPANRTAVPSERSLVTTVNDLSAESLVGVSVLVVDDSPDNRDLILHYLQQYGATIEFAENGFLGYKKALAGDHDVVLMDIQMPEMDGYTATQKLREAGYRMPVIALTAHAMSEVRRKCLLVGCTDHLTKPIKKNDLIEAVARYSV
jgi:PAS domain S-box-containing protein